MANGTTSERQTALRASATRTSATRAWVRAIGLVLLIVLIGAIGTYAHAGWYAHGIFHDRPAKAAGPERPAIVMLSGDMGDRIGMTPKVAARLHARGYAIVTVNSLSYFSPRRTAAEAAALVAGAMRRAMTLGRTDHVVLIGQSFGADMLHAGLAEFSDAARRPIRAVILVVPGHDIVFRASPVELAGWETPDALAWPTASRLTWAPVTCIRGAEERGSLCPELAMPNVRRIALPGGHRLEDDDAALAAAILHAIGEAR
ncbi:type IV secretion system protein VirJ [Sphingopyxis lindanitolerans]|uniref:Type IV secretion system protein VirJ n=1 Tax=Sphingopyxis lindanitolerans TaxID=2054227 RepID=A0A2S8B8R0_9SPHN|nr:AcvB/VirJ family lysyl-phosphatidylglycerol hydrolase [Sphingopyxis lindanitolerans]PQM28795.1 type IV secretion system protein VirJ [Sphingopyxis lindanitolerans]